MALENICLWKTIINQPETEYNLHIKEFLMEHKYEPLNKCYACEGKKEDCIDYKI